MDQLVCRRLRALVEPEALTDAHASFEQSLNAALEGVGIHNVLPQQPGWVQLAARVGVEERHPIVGEPLIDEDGHLQPRRAVELLDLLTLTVDGDSRGPLCMEVLSDLSPFGLLPWRQRVMQLAHAAWHDGGLEQQS